MHTSVLKFFLKMHVAQLTIQRATNHGQRQIMRTHESDSPAIQESINEALCSNAAIIRICALQQFVQQEEQRWATVACKVEERTESGDLCIKARASLLQRIVHADAGTDLQRRKPKALCPNRSASHCKHSIDADCSQQGALARHIRSAYQEHTFAIR